MLHRLFVVAARPWPGTRRRVLHQARLGEPVPAGNWLFNGIPERFPELKTIWIESGLAWLPFLMQRLDHEYLLRSSDAPLLCKLPSDYMRDIYYTLQPMLWTDSALLESTLKAMDAENTLLWSSDWPHWDFDPPGRIMAIPFLSDQAKRNILGGNAKKIFGDEKLN